MGAVLSFQRNNRPHVILVSGVCLFPDCENCVFSVRKQCFLIGKTSFSALENDLSVIFGYRAWPNDDSLCPMQVSRDGFYYYTFEFRLTKVQQFAQISKFLGLF